MSQVPGVLKLYSALILYLGNVTSSDKNIVIVCLKHIFNFFLHNIYNAYEEHTFEIRKGQEQIFSSLAVTYQYLHGQISSSKIKISLEFAVF